MKIFLSPGRGDGDGTAVCDKCGVESPCYAKWMNILELSACMSLPKDWTRCPYATGDNVPARDVYGLRFRAICPGCFVAKPQAMRLPTLLKVAA